MEKSATTRHGLLSGSRLLILDSREGWIKEDISQPTGTLSDLCTLILAHGLTHLWIDKDYAHVPDSAFFEAAREEWDLLPSWRYPPQRKIPAGVLNPLLSVVGCKKPRGGQKQLQVIFIATAIDKGSWRWLTNETTPAMLLLTVGYLERAFRDTGFDIPVGSSPSTVGIKLLQQQHIQDGNQAWISKADYQIFKTIPFTDAAKDLVWQRALTEQEMQPGYYLHKLDKNAAYLGAAAAAMFGVAVPYHVRNGKGVLKGEDGKYGKKIGVYRCEVKGGNSPQCLPDIWNIQKDGTWLTSGIIHLLCNNGYQVDVLEGFEFPQQHGVFRKWAILLWEMRLAFRQGKYTWAKNAAARKNCEDALKDVAVETNGLTRSSKVDEESFKKRPDWYMQVVAKNREIVWCNARKIYDLFSLVPVLYNMDALYYALPYSSQPFDILVELSTANGLGAYKSEWKPPIPIDEKVVAILSTKGYITNKIEQLNKIQRGLRENQNGQ